MPPFARFSIAAVMAACLGQPVAAQDDVSPATVVATVNGTEITLGHMLVLRSRLPAQYQQLDEQVLYDAILDQLIQQTVLGETAGELSEVNRLVLANEERALLASQVVSEAAEAAVTDEAVQAAYEAAYADAGGDTEYNAAHILVETEEEAATLVAELADGAEFGALAREHSTGPSGPNGGDLGWFSEGMMVPPFEQAVLALEVGQVSGPVETQFGWHVIVLNDTRQTTAPELEAVRGEVEMQVQQEAVQALVERLTADADIVRPDEPIDPAILSDTTLLFGE